MSQARSIGVARPQRLDATGVRIPERTLTLLRDLVNAHTGMSYEGERLEYLRDRLSPLALERGFDSLLDYYYLLKYDGTAAEEWPRVIDALSVQETYFWREVDQVQALTRRILPSLVAAGRRSVRIWSVPCATGEEPLSIAMALEEDGWFNRLGIEIYASDASEAALRKAEGGRYGPRAFRQLPQPLWEKYFDPVATNTWAVKPALKARISLWNRVNVVQPQEVAMLAAADVIFCRNLFIYFNETTVRAVAEQFADCMRTPGFLCVGAAESLLRVTTRFELQDIGGAYVYVRS
ncbi:MAG TPA: protein-glutamate O-methyltransferase CheR [Vicinamibacterales bacterium]|nr:protein-glutamate O-methyltransferase CheR [Vicinamibacterales bacterium]